MNFTKKVKIDTFNQFDIIIVGAPIFVIEKAKTAKDVLDKKFFLLEHLQLLLL